MVEEENNKINILDRKYEDWISVNDFDLNAKIADKIQVIYCDTRDFFIGWDFKQPKINKNANYNYEYNQNKGLQKFYKIVKKKDNKKREKYTINKKDILKWLDELCKKTGGYECEWRYLDTDVDYCRNWDIKYIRFIRNNKNPDEFIVCNNYLFPIEYREIIDKIDKEYLYPKKVKI